MSTATQTDLTTSAQKQELQTLQQRATQFAKVETQAQYTACVQFIGDCRTWRKGIDATFAEARGKAYAAWKSLCSTLSSLTDPVEAMEKQAEVAAKAFERRQEQLKAEEEARRRAEIEASERREREITAMMAEEDGNMVAAEAARAAPSIAAPVSLPTSTYIPKVAGAARKKKWKAEVTSLKELAGGVWRGEVPEAALIGIEDKDGVLRSSFLDARAAEYKTKLPYPGVRAYEDSGFAFR